MFYRFLSRAALTLCLSVAALPNFAQRGAITPDMLSNFRKSVPNTPASKALQNALITTGVSALPHVLMWHKPTILTSPTKLLQRVSPTNNLADAAGSSPGST